MAKNKDAEVEGEESLDEGGSRVYELAFHLDPELPSEEIKKEYAKIRATIEAVGTIVAEGAPQQLQLAYTISRQEPSGRRDFDSAYFAWIAYEADASKHAEAVASVKADGRVIRFLDILTDKESARHSAEIREIALQVPQMPSEQAADAELDAALEEVLPAQASVV